MRKNRKKGFTMVELIVVLIILSIIAAIAVPFFINYWRKAEFRKNEENARQSIWQQSRSLPITGHPVNGTALRSRLRKKGSSIAARI